MKNHFGINYIKSKYGLNISKEKYLTASVKNSFHDKEYSEEKIINLKESAAKNYDINMSHFNNLNSDEFNIMVKKFISDNYFEEVKNLNDFCYSGIYLMVLDQYKQVYIGQASNICSRISSHWSKNKPLDRLVFGTIENSKIAIDSFGRLDTTRIYVKHVNFDELFEEEHNLSNLIPNKYLLNRITAGITKDAFSLGDVKTLG